MDKRLGKALETLNKPGVILAPTETVYGISCSAFEESQIERIYNIKQRPKNKSFIVLVDSEKMIEQFVNRLSPSEKELLNDIHPTTVILSDVKNLPKSLMAEDGSLAFRITQHPEIKKLISMFGSPIISTSANITGKPTAISLKDVDPCILEAVDYTLDLQSEFKPSSIPSRIVKITDGNVEIIRA